MSLYTVPAEFRPALDNARHFIASCIDGLLAHDDACFQYDAEPQEVENEARSGFWPWTAGGYEVCLAALLSRHAGSGTAPAPLQPILDSNERFVADAWAEQYPDRPALLDCICADDGEPGSEWREAAYDFEQDAQSADNSCYFYKARCFFVPAGSHNHTGSDSDEVHLDCYLNTDLDYGRDSVPWLRAYGQSADQTAGDWLRVMSVPAFVALSCGELDALAADAVASLP